MFHLYVLWCSASSLALVFASDEGPALPRLQVALRSDSQDYVLGQPVLLTVSAKNVSGDTIRFHGVLVQKTEPEISLYISEDGKVFKKYLMGIYGNVGFVRTGLDVLRRDETREYRLRILYGYYGEGRLAFDRAGSYWVKVRYPFKTYDPVKGYKREPYYSNVVQIRIHEPKGNDAKVWETIRRPEFIYFLQSGKVPGPALSIWFLDSGKVPRNYEKIGMETAKLLQSIPKSSYTPALRYALEKHYAQRRGKMTREQAMEDPELKLIRSVTGIQEPLEGPFPEDPRLNVEIAYHFPQLTPLELVFELISEQSGVPLGLAPELRIRRLKSAHVRRSLRQFMISEAAYKAKWMRDGVGYRLVPAPQPEPQPPAQPKPQTGHPGEATLKSPHPRQE